MQMNFSAHSLTNWIKIVTVIRHNTVAAVYDGTHELKAFKLCTVLNLK